MTDPKQKLEKEREEKFFAGVRNLLKYRLGNKYYFLRENKITEGVICVVDFHHEYTIDFSVRLRLRNDSKVAVPVENLYETKEEAAEAFLDNNEIPKKLLQVLTNNKPKTTVADLIERLQTVNPSYDLGNVFHSALNLIMSKACLSHEDETTDEYWDCECETAYIHPHYHSQCSLCGKARKDAPSSRVVELKLENISQREEP